jgi:hypothetical protein
MKRFFLLLTAAFAVGVCGETVVKNSAAFAFPATVGAIRASSFQNRDVLFSYSAHSGSRGVFGLSWSLPVKAEKGSIAVYTLTGTKVKTFLIREQQGSVIWDITSGKRLVSGVYIATLTSGTCKKNLQILLSR